MAVGGVLVGGLGWVCRCWEEAAPLSFTSGIYAGPGRPVTGHRAGGARRRRARRLGQQRERQGQQSPVPTIA